MGTRNGIELPFKPFSADEVCALTCCKPSALDWWFKVMGTKKGCGEEGLDFMQTFGVYVGNCWLAEGATVERATATAKMIATVAHEYLVKELEQGRSFPVPHHLLSPGKEGGLFVEPPPTTLGRRLDLRALYSSFRNQMAKVFPDG